VSTAPWWEAAFDEDYLEVYAHRDDAQGAAEIAGLLPHLHGPVLDAGCGGGRHLAALRAAGLTALGFDFSAPLLTAARDRPAVRGRLAQGDLRRPPVAEGAWGAVLLLFTAFGYFDDDTNGATLAALGRLLRPDGMLVLDLPHAERVRKTLVPRSQRTTASGIRIQEERWLTPTRVEKRVTLTHADGRTRSYVESVRLYEDLAPLAQAAGLRVRQMWPSLRGADIDEGRQVWWLEPT